MTETANIHGTDGDNLTLRLPDFELEDIRRGLIAARLHVGANTPKGHRLSNAVEQLDNYRTALGEQKVHLERLIRRTMTELTASQ